MPLYIGLMSGTSVDSVDAVLTRIDDGAIESLERHEQAIAAKRAEQEQLRKQYAAELERYRELKNRGITQQAQKKDKKR